MSRRMIYVLPLLLAVGLSGCVSDDESVPPSGNPNAGFKARYVPLGGIVPFPNDIFISQTDGTLDLPVADPDDFGDPLVAMNTLDGFSLNAAITATFTDSIDDATVIGGIPGVVDGSVYVLDVTDPAAPALLIPGQDYSAGLSPGVDNGQFTLQITPIGPLNPDSRYAFVLTNGIENTVGDPATADTTFQQIKDAVESGSDLADPTLNAIKNALAPLLGAATAPTAQGGLGLTLDEIVAAWTFSTQSIGDVLAQVETDAIVQLAAVTAFVGTTDSLAGTGGSTEVYAGMIQLPYYLDADAPLTGFWQGADGSFLTRFNTEPVATGTITVPFLITVPDGGAATGVVIFQHGITQDRTNVIAVADALAGAGHAAIAIDLPLHGITDTASGLYAPEGGGNPLYPNVFGEEVTEAHFYLDVLNNSTGEPGSDGTIDGSGQSFINLPSLLTSRDNLRQAAANLIHLAKTVPTISFDGTAQGGSIFDLSGLPIRFVGHSLGGITGTVFLAVNVDAGAATLGMPGGNVSQLLINSPTFAPRINAGLAAQGLVQNTQLYFDFFRNAQTVIDAGDPVNYGATANADHPIHMIEVIGGAGSPPDQVVPNSATEALVNAMGLPDVNTDTLDAGGVDGVVCFTAGDHASLLDPSASLDATVEMQTQMATFVASGGTFIDITNGAVIGTCP